MFEYVGAALDVIELFSYDTATGTDFNRICFSKTALSSLLHASIEQLFNERIDSLKVIRNQTLDGDYEYDDELIRRDITDRLIGEFIVHSISVRTNWSDDKTVDISTCAKYCIHFVPPDLYASDALVVSRPACLSGVVPYRDIEIQR